MGIVWQSDLEQPTPLPERLPDLALPPLPRRTRRRTWLLLVLLLVTLAFALSHETRTSQLQAWALSRYAESLVYRLQPGPSDALFFPEAGPFDKRLGYAYLPQMLERLQARDYVIQQQVRFSPALRAYSRKGFFVPYPEKIQSGLLISDCRGTPLYQFHYPQHLYTRFDDIPPLVVDSLLFIENRNLLEPGEPQANPAVDWPRFAKAALSQLGKAVGRREQSAGGSTLATQLEKYRHAPDGLTLSAADKLRQMLSASVRAYQAGPETLDTRQRIVRDYLNSVPLSAVPGHGEVHGLAEGLRVWFGADFTQVNLLLDPSRSPQASAAERGLALRQVLSLMIAQRRPTYYLG
ncbi:MAG TPA: biosynthetic peptidoglycan transglycosylase, partial [Pseudomonas sp.]|nr:biosynthetic peptidoglycan transglycosylase [Pseudomonas sp.]